MSHTGIQLAYLELMLSYSKGQPGNRNDVSPNILSLMFKQSNWNGLLPDITYFTAWLSRQTEYRQTHSEPTDT